MVTVSKNSVLLIIDVQVAWNDPVWGKRNNLGAEAVMAGILRDFRKHGLKVIHVRHDSGNPESLLKEGKPTFEFKKEVTPMEGEPVIVKHVHSALIGTPLESMLREMGEPDIYMMGIATDYCISSTARMAGNLGFSTFVVRDGCAAFQRTGSNGELIPAETVHEVNLASLNGAFATIIDSDQFEF